MNQTAIETPPLRPHPSGGDIQFPPYLTPRKMSEYTPERLKALIGGRKLYLRGAAFSGQALAKSLSRLGLEFEAFIDKSPRLRGQYLAGRPVLAPEDVFNRPHPPGGIFIILCTGFFEDDYQMEVEEAGFIKGHDYISAFELIPLFPSIDISGVCNLRCQGCPRGNMETHPPAGFMSAEVYAQVIDKLLMEMPFLGGVQLYTWGEPLLNRELTSIIGHNKNRRVLSVISTNLCLKPSLVEKMAAAGPEVVRVSCSGWGSNYEQTHTGGNWNLFLKNVRHLAALNHTLRVGMELEFYYHLYRHNAGADYAKVKDLVEGLGYAFRPVYACLLPRENVMALHRGRPISLSARRQLDLLTDEAHMFVQGDGRDGLREPCIANTGLGINWNLNVRVCCAVYLPLLAENFLETPLPELLRRMAESEICAECASCGANAMFKPFMGERRLTMELEKSACFD